MAKTHDKVVGLVNSLVDLEKQLLGLLVDFVPQEARKHVKAAHKEKLLALRAILDARIKRLDEQESGGRKKPQKVDVQ